MLRDTILTAKEWVAEATSTFWGFLIQEWPGGREDVLMYLGIGGDGKNRDSYIFSNICSYIESFGQKKW